ncbi:SHOCT domain-containing protein [Psychroserpens sp.]|uniref:SHOCT domain-containing protein n=1 Tax=Psychroserpens sp. TaxID=2020870 RepID=UPI0030031FA1
MLEIKGRNGTLVVTENKIIIKRKGLVALLNKGSASDKEIPINNISAIEFFKGNMLVNGKIQFSVPGEVAVLQSKPGDFEENTIIFLKKQSSDFLKAKKMIEDLKEKLEQNSNPVINQISNADELKKFAELKEQGIITEEEFKTKKKELLDL